MKLLLGVASGTNAASEPCKFCGSVRDVRGIHDRSCTAGGDVVLRHNAIRDAIYRFATRGRLDPALERVGLLAEAGVLLDLQRPADVLIDRALNSQPSGLGAPPLVKLAIDNQFINTLGADHLEAASRDPLGAAEAFHDHALTVQQTAAGCME